MFSFMQFHLTRGEPITGVDKYWNLHDIFETCVIQLLPYGFHGLLSQISVSKIDGQDIVQTRIIRPNCHKLVFWRSVAHQNIVATRHFQLTCTNYAFSLASVALLLRAHLQTLAHDETKVRLWMHRPENIKHNIYFSHGRARPNAGGCAPDVRHLPQPTASAAGGARVRQA